MAIATNLPTGTDATSHAPASGVLMFSLLLPFSIGAAAPLDSPAPPGPSSDALEEVTVTARKTSESMMNVPVAVSAVSSAELNRSGVIDINRIAQLVPQVIAARGDQGSGASFTIRGIGSSPQDAGIEQSVTLNIDGVQMTRGNAASLGFFDLAQVEVLKGPQALFFGKNSPAGVISLQSVTPTRSLEGYVRGGYEFVADERYVEAAISGPITDKLRVRAAIRGTKMNGWIKNEATGLDSNPFMGGLPTPGADPGHDPNSAEALGRLTIVYEPTDRLDFTARISGSRYTDDGGSSARTRAICTGDHPTIFGVPDTTQSCAGGAFKSSGNTNPALTVNWPGMHGDGKFYTSLWSGIYSLTTNYRMDNLTLTSVTGYYKLHVGSTQDATHSNFTSAYGFLFESSDSFSEELRAVSQFAGPVNFTVGVYFDHTSREDYESYLLAFAGQDAATGKYDTFEQPSLNKGRTWSSFGQLRWQVIDRVELTGGVRWTKENKSTQDSNTFVHPALQGPLGIKPAGEVIDGRFEDSNWSPEATISWHPTDQALVYAAYKTGYKSGGFSYPGLLSVGMNADNLRFQSEKSKGGEIGTKLWLLDRTLRMEATAYLYDYSGLQLAQFDQTTFSFFIRNAASSRLKGFELSGEWLAMPGLRFNGSFGYNHARFSNYDGAPCYNGEPISTSSGGDVCVGGVQDLTGKRLTRAPDLMFTSGFTYETSIGRGLMAGVNGDIRYSSGYYTQEDHNPVGHQPAFTLFNAGLRIYTADEKYQLALIGRNLTNKFYFETTSNKIFGGPTDLQAQVPRLRELNLQATYRF